MRIALANDQVFPLEDTDTEQIMAMASALGVAGARVDLWLPRPWAHQGAGPAQLGRYYQVEPAFTIRSLASLFPGPRAIEKAAHAVRVALSPALAQADILYTRNLPTVMAALGLSRTPVLYETYRPWPDQVPLLAPLLRWMAAKRRFLGAVLHSELAARSFRALGLEGAKVLVAHNGYHPQRMEPVLTRDEARRRTELPLGPPLAVYLGRVDPSKGVGALLDLAQVHRQVNFAIVGSRGQGELERRAKSMSNVIMVPRQPFRESVSYLYAADILLIPPTLGPLQTVGTTVLPIKTFLYMAAGRPILAADTPDIREVLQDGVNAILVRPDDPLDAARGLQALLDDPALAARLAQAAKDQVRDQTWDRRARTVLAFVEERLGAV